MFLVAFQTSKMTLWTITYGQQVMIQLMVLFSIMKMLNKNVRETSVFGPVNSVMVPGVPYRIRPFTAVKKFDTWINGSKEQSEI